MDPFGTAPDDDSEEKGGEGKETMDDTSDDAGSKNASSTSMTGQKNANASRQGDESSNTLNDLQD